MKVLITAGGTREYIDDVRVVTNISSGALGAKIAEEFYSHGWQVHYVHAKYGIMPCIQEGISDKARLNSWPFVTTSDLYDTMKAILMAFKIDVVIHSAAVSDFTFERNENIKLSSDSADDFIEYMRKTIRPTPKIIQEIKKWAPETYLVGFKFTVGQASEELAETANKLAHKVNADLILANDKVEMTRESEHVMHFIYKRPSELSYPWPHKRFFGKDIIARSLFNHIKEIL